MALCAAHGMDLKNLRRNRKVSRTQYILLKNLKKGNDSNLPYTSGPLVRSASLLLPTRDLAALPAHKCHKDYPFPFGIKVYQQLLLPKCLYSHGSLVSCRTSTSKEAAILLKL